MDRLKTEWDKGVSKMKTLGQERKEEEPKQPQSAADISREDLLQLTMKLGARLKAAEKAHREVATRARDAERDRDVLKSFCANTVLGTPGVLDGVALDDASLMKLYGGRDTGGEAQSSAGDAQSSALKEALARALAARDAESSRADAEAAKRQNASSKAEERIVSLELKLRDARRDADGAPEALAGLELRGNQPAYPENVNLHAIEQTREWLQPRVDGVNAVTARGARRLISTQVSRPQSARMPSCARPTSCCDGPPRTRAVASPTRRVGCDGRRTRPSRTRTPTRREPGNCRRWKGRGRR